MNAALGSSHSIAPTISAVDPLFLLSWSASHSAPEASAHTASSTVAATSITQQTHHTKSNTHQQQQLPTHTSIPTTHMAPSPISDSQLARSNSNLFESATLLESSSSPAASITLGASLSSSTLSNTNMHVSDTNLLTPNYTNTNSRRRLKRKIVPEYVGDLIANQPTPPLEDVTTTTTTIQTHHTSNIDSNNMNTMDLDLPPPSDSESQLRELNSTSHFGFLSPFRVTATAFSPARSPLQPLDVQSRSPGSTTPAQARPTSIYHQARIRAAREAQQQQQQQQHSTTQPPIASAQAQASNALSGKTALPAPYLRVLQETTAAKNLAQNAFASGYKGRKAGVSGPMPAAAASASSSPFNLLPPSHSSSTWSNFRFDPHAFGSSTSSAGSSATTGVMISSAAAAASTPVVSSSSSTALHLVHRTGPSLVEQMSRRELEEMERITEATISTLVPTSEMSFIQRSNSDSTLHEAQHGSLSSAPSRESSHVGEDDLPPLPLLPVVHHHGSPRKSFSGISGAPLPFLPASSSSLPSFSHGSLHEEMTSPARTTSQSQDHLFVTPQQPPTKRRGRPRLSLSAQSATSPSLAHSAPVGVIGSTGDDKVRPMRKRKVRSESKASPPPPSTSATIGSESESLRLKRRSVKAMLSEADATSQRLVLGSSLSTSTGSPIASASFASSASSSSSTHASSSTLSTTGLTDAQVTQLRVQVQLHTQLLAQTIWLASVLPSSKQTQPIQTPSSIKHNSGSNTTTNTTTSAVGVVTKRRLPAQQTHREIASSARSCLRQLARLAGRQEHEKQAVANIILDLAGEMTTPTKKAHKQDEEEDEEIVAAADALSPVSNASSLYRPLSTHTSPSTSSTRANTNTTPSTATIDADQPILFTPFDHTSPIDSVIDGIIPVLNVPALGIWEDVRFEKLATGDWKEDDYEFFLDKENSPLSTSLTSVSPPIGGSYTKSRAGRAVLSLPSETVHHFWDGLVVTHKLDSRFLPKILPHERHLFTVSEEHLFHLGLQTLHWQLLPKLEKIQETIGSGTPTTATTTTTPASTSTSSSSSSSSPSFSNSTIVTSLSPAARGIFETTLLTKLRQRFLPAKSIKDLRDRLHKLHKKDQGKHVSLSSSSAAAAVSLMVSGELSPRSTLMSSVGDSAVVDLSSSFAAVAGGSAIGSSSPVTNSSSTNHSEPVTFLRDFTSDELTLVTQGWSLYHSHRNKWSLISEKFLPTWPRKLLAKAWSKHHERTLKTTLPHLNVVKKKGRPRKDGQTNVQAQTTSPIPTSIPTVSHTLMESMPDEPDDDEDVVSGRVIASTGVPLPPLPSTPIARPNKGQPWQQLYETMDDEGDEEDDEENSPPASTLPALPATQPPKRPYQPHTLLPSSSPSTVVPSPASAAVATGRSVLPLPVTMPSFTPAKQTPERHLSAA